MRKLKLFFITICMALILGILGLFKLNYVYAEGDSADFSSANYSVTSEFPKVILSITGIQNKSEGKPYYYKITGSTEQPKTEYTTNEEITKDGWQNLVIDGEGKVSGENIANYVELNQDLYLWVLEYDGSGEVKGKVVVNAKKLERPDVPEYTQVFSSNTHLTHSTTQLSFNMPWGVSSIRKFNIKIGKITDTSILQSIKNGESNAFEKLTTYAKSANSIYQEKLTTSGNGVNSNYYGDLTKDKKIQLSNVENGAYYYLYVDFDDESGKYYPIEGITISKATTYNNGEWYMFFLGNDDFSWDDFTQEPTTIETQTEPTQTPTALKQDPGLPKQLPKTGEGLFIISVFVVIIVVAIWLHSKNRKYDGI